MVTFSIFAGIIGAFCTCWFGGIMSAVDLEYGLQYMFVEWFIWCGIIKSLFFAFIIASVSAFSAIRLKAVLSKSARHRRIQ